jgi:hypothetical protein
MRAPTDPGAGPALEGPEPKPVPPRPSPEISRADEPSVERAPDKEPNRFLMLLLRALSAVHS